MNACFSHRKTSNHFLIRLNLQHFLWRENCTVFLLDSRSCKTSLLAHLQLFREEAELLYQVDAVSFSHVTSKLGRSLGSRRKEFISETEGSWQANSKNSHRVFCRRKFRLSLLDIGFVVILSWETSRAPERRSGADAKAKSNGAKSCTKEMSRFPGVHPKASVWGFGFWEPGLAAMRPASADSFISLSKQMILCISAAERWYCKRGKNKSNEGSVFHLTMGL